MTESEFLSSEDPQAMLCALQTPWGLQLPGGAVPQCDAQPSDRKLRLWACACYGTAVESGSIGRKAAEEAEWWADTGKCPPDEPNTRNDAAINFANPVNHAEAALQWSEIWNPCLALKADLLREIVGNPFRPVDVTICQQCGGHGLIDRETCRGASEGEQCPACRGLGRRYPRWRTPTVLSLAQAAYSDRNADGSLDNLTLCALADALEETGCQDETILRHLRGYEPSGQPSLYGEDYWKRSPGTHVRGCWAISLILGQE